MPLRALNRPAVETADIVVPASLAEIVYEVPVSRRSGNEKPSTPGIPV
ncbi:hypothetical protein AB0G74_11730 [Streptomyces sp. NPDC020875]